MCCKQLLTITVVRDQYSLERYMKKTRVGLFSLLLIVFLTLGSLAQAENSIPAPPEGNLRYSITVSKFKNEAGWHGKWDVGDGFATIIIYVNSI